MPPFLTCEDGKRIYRFHGFSTGPHLTALQHCFGNRFRANALIPDELVLAGLNVDRVRRSIALSARQFRAQRFTACPERERIDPNAEGPWSPRTRT